jgi:hypothetical protein
VFPANWKLQHLDSIQLTHAWHSGSAGHFKNVCLSVCLLGLHRWWLGYGGDGQHPSCKVVFLPLVNSKRFPEWSISAWIFSELACSYPFVTFSKAVTEHAREQGLWDDSGATWWMGSQRGHLHISCSIPGPQKSHCGEAFGVFLWSHESTLAVSQPSVTEGGEWAEFQGAPIYIQVDLFPLFSFFFQFPVPMNYLFVMKISWINFQRQWKLLKFKQNQVMTMISGCPW